MTTVMQVCSVDTCRISVFAQSLEEQPLDMQLLLGAQLLGGSNGQGLLAIQLPPYFS